MKSTLRKIKRFVKGFIESFESTPAIPSLIEKISVGTSVSGRFIDCYKIGKGDKKILFVSAIHGNEVGTVKLSYNLIKYLYEHTLDFQSYTFYIVPCLNPDGFALAQENKDYAHGGRIGRFNGHLVDLNRNFDVPSFQKESLWSYGKEYSESVKVNCGAYGNSEPETQAVTKFILNNKIDFLFSFHSVGADVLPAHDETSIKLAHIYAEKAQLKLMSDPVWHKLKQTGTFKEWCESKNISFLEIEIPTRYGSDWERQKEAIVAAVRNLNNKS